MVKESKKMFAERLNIHTIRQCYGFVGIPSIYTAYCFFYLYNISEKDRERENNQIILIYSFFFLKSFLIAVIEIIIFVFNF